LDGSVGAHQHSRLYELGDCVCYDAFARGLHQEGAGLTYKIGDEKNLQELIKCLYLILVSVFFQPVIILHYEQTTSHRTI
jgi:hypothetical protein